MRIISFIQKLKSYYLDKIEGIIIKYFLFYRKEEEK
jgi:hypothetical protein